MNRRHLLALALPSIAAAAGDAVADRLHQGRAVLLLRHALTDAGIGDPPGMRLGECATQRNLGEAGRMQARRIGAWFTAHGLAPSAVRSSAWCRCLDTGRLAFGRAEPWAPLNSFFDDASAREHQSERLAAALAAFGAGGFEVWITHQVNITALTGEAVSMGEGCVVLGAEASGKRVNVAARFAA